MQHLSKPVGEHQASHNGEKGRKHPKSTASKKSSDRVADLKPIDDNTKSKGKYTSFFERVEELKSFYKKHGHANVSERENKDLAIFCRSVRYARQKPDATKRKLGEERIAALDALDLTGKITSKITSNHLKK